MTTAASVVPSTASATTVKVPVWAWLLLAVAVFTIYVLAQENGALLSAPAAEMLHELTHDARHALGVPCH
jgi:putative cobalt transporter subunit CbtB